MLGDRDLCGIETQLGLCKDGAFAGGAVKAVDRPRLIEAGEGKKGFRIAGLARKTTGGADGVEFDLFDWLAVKTDHLGDGRSIFQIGQY